MRALPLAPEGCGWNAALRLREATRIDPLSEGSRGGWLHNAHARCSPRELREKIRSSVASGRATAKTRSLAELLVDTSWQIHRGWRLAEIVVDDGPLPE